MLWRETSAQHFDGGEGGNFPRKAREGLDDVDENFQCTSHPYQEMLAANYRNDLVRNPGFVDENLRLIIPILKIWNVTSMAADLHPVTLNNRTKADCTHFCPHFGGIYEVWSTLLQNSLAAAQPLQDTLRPRLFREVTPTDL
jgi:hypothetical protein